MRVRHASDGGKGLLISTDGHIALVLWDCHPVPLLCYASLLRSVRAQ